MKNIKRLILSFTGTFVNPRSQKVAIEILLSGVARIFTVIISFLQIPILLVLIDKTQYGVWLTIFSFINWFSLFDLGLGNGLRNKLTESFSIGNIVKSRQLIKSAYLIIGTIFIFILGLSIVLLKYVDWNSFLNTNVLSNKDLYNVILITSCGFTLNSIFNIVHTILAAIQKNSISYFVLFAQQLLILAVLYLLKVRENANLFEIALTFSAIPLITNIMFSLVFFGKGVGLSLNPFLSKFNYNNIKDIFQIGIKFFIIQIAALVLFSTSSILISKLFSPDEVAPYFIVNKYFSIISFIMSILTAPLWSGFSHAIALGDNVWIKRVMNRLILFCISLIPFLILMVISYKWVFALWLKDKIEIPFNMIISFAIFTFIGALNSVIAVYVNSFGKLNLQLYLAVFGAVINLPLSYYLSKNLNFGPVGIVWSVICQSIGTLFLFSDYFLNYKSNEKVN